MEKHTKLFLTATLIIALLFTYTPFSVAALEKQTTIVPRFSHLSTCNINFTASSAGGQAFINYEADDTTFSRASINVKLQKKFLLFFWTDVSEWNTTSTDCSDVLTHTFSLGGSGTYKAIFIVEIIGTDGTVDTVTKEIESSY